MNDVYTNAKRMVSLFEQMRHARSSPAFALLKQLNLSFSHMAVGDGAGAPPGANQTGPAHAPPLG
jgi:phage-related tail fiber protein